MSTVTVNNRWIVCPKPNPNATFRLFCFPFAGGSASVFRTWHKKLPDYLEVCSIQYPGRGTWMGETFYTDTKSMVEAAAQAIRSHLDKPFLFYGHSMGAIIAFELARYCAEQFGRRPILLMVGGRNAPDADREIEPIYHLPEAEFRAGLRTYGGTPDEVLANDELMDLFSPILRADFQLSETYSYEGGKVTCPIVAWGGYDDHMVPEDNLRDWKRFTDSRFTCEMLPGGHFFLQSHQEELLIRVKRELELLAQLSIWGRLQ
ncbi:alpha/beta fold hydrolase [Paenibacillus alvei]|uniref:thioesterase II family protein n=1 Tax=Paenibacillus TaxID=44249 RepID=UPI0002886C46|nr:alpha/beta fold hydrolase [Paenibacillus alvei]EJW15726.1 nonribosomal peptide synthetase subunit [Paenibacillus alvei DSM 29]MCY9542966.1 alpha/beta fold hydrolase [Paenibacillus alvei]MCY9706298.1 alpha/beta fold hydrolase [Paenibacillus alvei]MCY9734261.1 alpha/beta fold hydrolase [Paenibacillus alvei]MCY9757534.1 alpha/beta fold hydrolase [Paenibacillus alvei]